MAQISPSHNTTLISITDNDINTLDFIIGLGGIDIEESGSLQNIGNLTIAPSTELKNLGTLDNSGNFILLGAGSASGEYYPGVFHNYGNVSLAGIATINGKIVNYTKGVIDFENDFNMQSALTNFGGKINISGVATLTDGTMYGSIFNGIDSGGSYAPSEIIIEITGKIDSLGSAFYNYSGSTVTNNGSINIVGDLGELANQGGYITNNGRITLQKSSLFQNAAGGTIVNNGTIDNSLHPSTSVDENIIGFVNIENSTYTGSGHVLAAFIDNGKLAPGNSAGGMLFGGNVYKTGGTKEIELGGTYHGDGDRTATEHDWIEIKGDLELAGNLDVSLIDGFKLSAGDSFVITKVDGDLSGEYDGLNEGDSVGRFKSKKGGKLDLFLTYEGGDGNDIELYTKSFFSVLPDSLRDPRIIGSDDKDSLTGTSADEVIFGGSDDDVLLGGAGDDQVTGGNGNDKLNGGLGDDTLKGDRGADDYILSSGEDVYESFSIDENDQLVVGEGVDLSFQQVGDNLLIKGIAIHTTLLDVDKDEFLAADCIDFI
ncbi:MULTISPECIES: hypothetical protein [unclassified Prochlorococcus]|uniref:hypothetical protein n=1 Tax=unclassified Prochlorococcus TaxID=2627481 RepID=UPI0039A574EA